MLHLLLVLHLLSFAFAFAFTAGMGILQAQVARSGNAQKIHAVFVAAQPLSLTGGMLWIITAMTGILLAVYANMPLMQPWLVYSYVAFTVLILVGFGVHRPWQVQVIAAAASGPSPELDALLKSPKSKLASAVSGVAIIALVYFMTQRLG